MDRALLHDMVSSARRAGADVAEAAMAERRSLSVTVRLGELEEVEREESLDVGLRVFVGRRQAVVSGSDLSAAARAKLIERAVAMARVAPEDPYAGLAPTERLADGVGPELDLYDPTEQGAEALEHRARAAEDVVRQTAQVTNTDGASAAWSQGGWALVTSGGFDGAVRASSFSLSASAIAGEGSGMERGGEGRATRHAEDLPEPAAIGAEAARRAVERLGARKIDSRKAAVIFENRRAGSLIGPFVGAISGPAVARGVSFLKDKLGQAVFSPAITLVEDPFRPRGLGSAAFDDEGVQVQRRALVQDGVATTWLMNSASARQLGLQTTGHASRGLAGAPGVSTHNLTLQPGTASLEELMTQAGEGLLVTSMFGPSLNANTGDWSAGVSGVWFQGGAPAYPVTEITVAGNLLDIYARLVPGADLEIRGANNSPSLLVDGLAIAGR